MATLEQLEAEQARRQGGGDRLQQLEAEQQRRKATIVDWKLPTPFGDIPLFNISKTHPDEPLGTLHPEDAARYLDDTVRSAANAVTFNMADRAAAEMSDLTGVGGPNT